MFVEFKEAESWYVVALDGIRNLESSLHSKKKTNVSEFTRDQIHGMSQSEWEEFLDERESEHEMFASLAVLASFEGSIRRDAIWRGSVDRGQNNFQSFHSVVQEAHIPIAKLFEIWESLFSRGHPLRKQFSILRELYGDRNVIAHGRARRGQFVFRLIFSKLEQAHRKWREFVPDFDRY